MTSTIVIANPYNSTHDASITVQTQATDGTWNSGPAIPLPPNTTAPGIVIDGKTRIFVEETAADRMRGPAAPKA